MKLLEMILARFCRRCILWERWAAATPFQRMLALHIAATTRSAQHG